jgi:hypothetical protein
MPHGHPDNYPDRSNEPNRRAFGRPTPRIDALINNTLALGPGRGTLNIISNAGSRVTAAHRKNRAEMLGMGDLLPAVANMPNDEYSNELRETYAESLSKATDRFEGTSTSINGALAKRHEIRADAKKMAEEKFEWPDE